MVVPAEWTVALGDDADNTVSLGASGSDIALTLNGTIESRSSASVTGIAIRGGGRKDRLTIDASFHGAGIGVAFHGGGGSDTLAGPAVDSTWNVTGLNAGSLGSVTFDGVESLVGAAGNKDSFVVQRGGSIESVDGGEGGWDSLAVVGDGVKSRPTGPQSGHVVLDGKPIAYSALEPISISGSDVTIDGTDSALLLKKDLFRISDGSGGVIQVKNFDPTGTFELSESHDVTLSSGGTLTINGGEGTDAVEFTGNYTALGTNLVVNAEKITVKPGMTINVGTGDITFNAITKDNGFSILGITTTIPVLGAESLVDIDGATLTGNNISLKAFSGTLSTAVNGAQTIASGGALTVDSVQGFEDTGRFTIAGVSGTCVYTGRDAAMNQFTGIMDCSGRSPTMRSSGRTSSRTGVTPASATPRSTSSITRPSTSTAPR